MPETSVLARIAGIPQMLRSYWTGTYTQKDPAFAEALGIGPTSSGATVTADTAFNSSAFWSAVAIISGDKASLPLELFKQSKDGTKEPFVGSKTYELVHDNPNPEMTSMVFREALQAHVLTWGNAYAEIERNGGGQPLALWPITPNRVTPFRNGAPGYPVQTTGPLGTVFYHVTNTTKRDAYLPASDVLHIPGLGFDGLVGYSVIEKARESIGMGLAMQQFGGTFFRNGSTFGGVLTHPGKLTKEVKQGIRESVEAIHQGADRAHKFAIFGDGMKFEKGGGIPPNDAQFLESRRFEIEEIARWFHMPQHKLNGLDHATFSNIEHLDLEYYKGCLRGWLVRWEQELNRKLIPPLERKSQYFKHNVEGFLRGDSVTRGDYLTKLFSVGGFSINEIRELNNQNGIGPDGDAHFVPANLMPVSRALNPPAPAPVPQPTAPAPTTGRDDDGANEVRRLLAEIASKTAAIETRVIAEQDASSQQEREAHRVAIEQLEAERAALHVQCETFRERHAADANRLAAEADAARKEASDERTARESAEALARRLSAKHARATAHITAAHAAQAEADSKLQASEVTLNKTLEQTALAEARAVSLAQDTEVERAARLKAEAEALTAVQAVSAAEQAATDALARAAQADAVLADLRAKADVELQARTAELEALKQADAERLSSMLAAHRALFVHAISRLVREEADKARRHQATPQKLRHWLDAFYLTHEDTCLNALRPAMRIHLAWKQSTEDVEVVTLALVREHIAESTRQILAVLDGTDSDELSAMLDRTLTRWEQHRPEALADRILREEVDYVRGG